MFPLFRDRLADQTWPALRRLLNAHAPSGGCLLPGAIADDIHALAIEYGLAAHWLPQIGYSGNAGLVFGAPADAIPPAVDLVIAAHMDRPSFRVRHMLADGAALYPICADRFPAEGYHARAKALRFQPATPLNAQEGGLNVGTTGQFVFQPSHDPVYRLQADDIQPYDVVTLDADPTLTDGVINGTGLDNALGMLAALLAGRVFAAQSATLTAAGRCIVIAFTDQEEGIPTDFFGHGAARLTHALPVPRLGAIISDAMSVNDQVRLGGGAAHGTASAWGRGSYAPPHMHRLAVDLAAVTNTERPASVQINDGYQSRSDDLALSRWTRILGMAGVPMTNAHTAHESAHLADVPLTGAWLAAFALAACGLPL